MAKPYSNMIENPVNTLPGRARLKRNEKIPAKGVKKQKLSPLQEAILVKPAK